MFFFQKWSTGLSVTSALLRSPNALTLWGLTSSPCTRCQWNTSSTLRRTVTDLDTARLNWLIDICSWNIYFMSKRYLYRNMWYVWPWVKKSKSPHPLALLVESFKNLFAKTCISFFMILKRIEQNMTCFTFGKNLWPCHLKSAQVFLLPGVYDQEKQKNGNIHIKELLQKSIQNRLGKIGVHIYCCFCQWLS